MHRVGVTQRVVKSQQLSPTPFRTGSIQWHGQLPTVEDVRQATRTTEVKVGTTHTDGTPNELSGREPKVGGTKNVVKDAPGVKLKDCMTGRNAQAVRARSIGVIRVQQGIPS